MRMECPSFISHRHLCSPRGFDAIPSLINLRNKQELAFVFHPLDWAYGHPLWPLGMNNHESWNKCKKGSNRSL